MKKTGGPPLVITQMNTQTPAAKPMSARWLPAWLFIVLVMFSLPAFARVQNQPQGMQTGFRFKNLNINDGLSQNFVSAICQDDTGFLWIGSKDGLNMYDGYSFTIFKHNSFEANSLSDNFVQVIFCDQQGRLWIGTLNGGLNLLDRSSGKFIRFMHDPDNPNSISNNNITAIVDDQFENIWVGISQGGLNKISFLTSDLIPQAENISVQRFDPASDGLSFDEVTISSLFRDSYNVIWIGSNSKTFRLENSRDKDHFTEVRWQLSGQSDMLSALDYDMSEGRIIVFEDHEATTWMLSRVGLFRHNRSADKFIQFHYAHLPDVSDGYTYGPKAATAFLNKGINELWLSTEKGLTVLNPGTGRLITMGNDPEYAGNLANGNAISLLADMSANMWVGSNGYGLSVYDPYKLKFIYPNDTGVDLDGSPISSRDLSVRSFLESKEGMLWIGSNKGFFRMNRATADMRQVKIHPSPDIKDLIVYSIREGDDGLLWLGSSTNHNITFTNLQPGQYTLKVRGTNNDGMWSEHVATMEIIIAKPWWGTNMAWIFYALVFFSIFMGFRKYEIARLRLKNQMKLADLEAGKLKDIDALKSKFFTNISHEFRTPLTLIKGPLEQMLSEASDHQQKRILSVMHANTERMLDLINQILELSKLESGEYNLKVSRGGIVSFVKGFVLSFTSLAEKKEIKFRFIEASSLKDPLVESDFYYDKDVLEKILTNILSNAFRFTPSGGRVTVTACLRTQKNGQKKFEITITDTGIGIASEKLPFIYDRFYQVDDSSKRAYEGTGIGLAYAKELVDLHKGHIAVMSKPDEGTTFRLRFPLGNYMFDAEQVEGAYGHREGSQSYKNNHQAKSQFTEPQAGISDASSDKATDNNKPIVLVVEDHDEVREYIRNGLIDTCELIEASNASDGLTMAIEHIPDLIISDVMMPGIDGFECCKQIKTNDVTSHIPVILLTARADVKDKIQGLETGADDYLTKPFSTAELKLRVRNIIESRRLLREKFSNNEVIKPADISVTSRDQTFMEKLFRIVEQNIRREQFSIEDFAKEAGMSQSQLNRKLKALINQSAVHFIRARRMHNARELLEKDAGNIADIAYMVGYNDPAYFTRTFKAFFGMPPSEVRRGNWQSTN